MLNSIKIIFITISIAFTQLPKFDNIGKILTNNGQVIGISQSLSPCIVDWNDDGKKDLLFGYLGPNIYYYENIGTDIQPIFNSSEFLKAGGQTIALSSG